MKKCFVQYRYDTNIYQINLEDSIQVNAGDILVVISLLNGKRQYRIACVVDEPKTYVHTEDYSTTKVVDTIRIREDKIKNQKKLINQLEREIFYLHDKLSCPEDIEEIKKLYEKLLIEKSVLKELVEEK